MLTVTANKKPDSRRGSCLSEALKKSLKESIHMAGANRLYWPRRGSLQFRPRKRAANVLPRMRSYAHLDTPKLIGYVGYKAGMTHIQFTDTRNNSLTKGMTVATAVTIIECPSILPVSICFYKKTDSNFNRIAEIFAAVSLLTTWRTSSGSVVTVTPFGLIIWSRLIGASSFCRSA